MVEQVDASEGAIKVGSAPTIDRSSEVLAAVASPEENSGVPGEVLVSDTTRLLQNRFNFSAFLFGRFICSWAHLFPADCAA